MHAPVPVTIADPSQEDCPLVLANIAFEALTGYSEEELLGKNCRVLQDGSAQEIALSDIRHAIAKQRETQVILRNQHKDGTRFNNLLFLYPLAGGLMLGSQFKLPQTATLDASVSRHREIAEMLDRLSSSMMHSVVSTKRVTSDAVASTVRLWLGRAS